MPSYTKSNWNNVEDFGTKTPILSFSNVGGGKDRSKAARAAPAKVPVLVEDDRVRPPTRHLVFRIES